MVEQRGTSVKNDLRALATVGLLQIIFFLVVWPMGDGVRALVEAGETGKALWLATVAVILCLLDIGWITVVCFRHPKAEQEGQR